MRGRDALSPTPREELRMRLQAFEDFTFRCILTGPRGYSDSELARDLAEAMGFSTSEAMG